MAEPFVGPPQVGNGCAYGLDLTDALCGQPETVHILADCAWGRVSLRACEEHAPLAREAGLLAGEHAYGPGCSEALCWEASDG